MDYRKFNLVQNYKIMKPSILRRIRRRTASHEVGNVKKENAQEQSFFGEAAAEHFFQPSAVMQRKCAECEKEEKIQRTTGKKEEEKLQKKEDKKEEDKLQKKEEKKEDEKLMKKEEQKEEEKVQKKEVAGSSGSQGSVSNYVSSLSSKGNPIPAEANQFFSSRMGYDFSHVKVHTDQEAVASAKEVNAKAYSIGNHVVFNEGQYNTASNEGKKLMAHELTHVVQQDQMSNEIKRKVAFKPSSAISDINLAANYVEGVKNGTHSSHSGITKPYMNGIDLIKTAGNHFNTPADGDLSTTKATSTTGDSYITTVAKESVNTFTYKMHIPAFKKIWSTSVDANSIKSQLKKDCPGQISVHIEGDPDSKTLVRKIKTHEEKHVADWKSLVTTILEPLDKSIKGVSMHGSTEKISRSNLLKHAETLRNNGYKKFIKAYHENAVEFHSSDSGANVVFAAYNQDSDCMWVKVKAKL